jgi:hypothetical protein
VDGLSLLRCQTFGTQLRNTKTLQTYKSLLKAHLFAAAFGDNSAWEYPMLSNLIDWLIDWNKISKSSPIANGTISFTASFVVDVSAIWLSISSLYPIINGAIPQGICTILSASRFMMHWRRLEWLSSLHQYHRTVYLLPHNQISSTFPVCLEMPSVTLVMVVLLYKLYLSPLIFPKRFLPLLKKLSSP